MTLPTQRQPLLAMHTEAANIGITLNGSRAQALAVSGLVRAGHCAGDAMAVFLQEVEILRPEKF